MKSDILLFPSSEKAMLISLFSKFFQDNLLSEKEYNRDRKLYDKNYEIWQKFLESSQKDDPNNIQFKETIKDMIVQIQDILMNIKSDNAAVIPYLAEFNSLIQKTDSLNTNLNTPNDYKTQSPAEYQKKLNYTRQHSNPPKPSQINGDSIVDEEKDIITKAKKGIRTHKKTFSTIINNNQQKQTFEGKDQQRIRKPNSIIDLSGINVSIDIQNNQSSCKSQKTNTPSSNFYGQNKSNQHIYNSIDIVNSSQNITGHNEIIQLTDFFIINNTNNYNENYQILLQENNFIESKAAYIFKLLNGSQEKMMSMIDQLLFSVNMSHYQDMFQNNNPDQWHNLFQILMKQNNNIMDSQQVDFMKQAFIEFYDSLQQKKDNPIKVFGDFLQKSLSSDQFSECLQKIVKDQIASVSNLNENNKDIFNNWFVKNEQTNTLEIDSQKIKQLSFSLKKKIIIFKLSTTMNSVNSQSSTSTIQILQPYEHSAADRSAICILWHNTPFADNFYLVLNEQQKLYFQNRVQQNSIQTKEISLQRAISDSFSTKTNSSANSPFSVSSSKHKGSYDIHNDQTNQLSQFSTSLSSYNIQQNQQQQLNVKSPQVKNSPFLQKYQSNPNSPKTKTTSNITGFKPESIQKLKENVTKLKILMIEDAFSINSLVMQIENNWVPRQNAQIIRNPATIHGNQNQNRGREFVQPQIKQIMNQNTRSASQNQTITPQEESPQIKNISKNQYFLNYNASTFQNNQRIPQLQQQDARSRIQSGHVPSVNNYMDDSQSNKYPQQGNAQIGSKNLPSNLTNNVLNKAQSTNYLQKNEEQKEEQIENRSGYGQPMIQLLNNQKSQTSKYGNKFQNTIQIQKQDDDKNFLKQIGATYSNSTTNQQQSSYLSNPSGQFFQRNNLNESPIRNQSLNQGQKQMKSVSSHQGVNNLSPRKELTINNGIQNQQEYQAINKLITPKSVQNQQNIIIR